MINTTYIQHITLTTGHTRRSPRAEVDDYAIEVVRELIALACTGDAATAVSLPVPGYSLTARRAGKCMTAIVYADGPPSVAVCTIGVAAHSRCGAGLWRALNTIGETPVVTDAEQCPPEPWLAVALDAGIDKHSDASEWLGDFERCLAWAFIEQLNRTSDAR